MIDNSATDFKRAGGKRLDKNWKRGYNSQKSNEGERIVKANATAMMNMMEMYMRSMCMRRRAHFPMCFLVS